MINRIFYDFILPVLVIYLIGWIFDTVTPAASTHEIITTILCFVAWCICAMWLWLNIWANACDEQKHTLAGWIERQRKKG